MHATRQRPARLVPPLSRLVAVCATLSREAPCPAVRDSAASIVALAAPTLVTPETPRAGSLRALRDEAFAATVALVPYGVGQAWLVDEVQPAAARLFTACHRHLTMTGGAS